MLIIEGPDMIGKTTLVAQIATMLRERSRGCPLTAEKYGLEEIMHMTTAQWIGRIKRWNIVDRFWPSAMIYRPFYFQGRPCVPALDHERIMMAVKRRGGRLLVLHATEAHYEKLLAEVYPTRHEQFPPGVCREGNRAYAEIAASSLCDCSLRLDGTGYAMDIAPGKIAEIVTGYVRDQSA